MSSHLRYQAVNRQPEPDYIKPNYSPYYHLTIDYFESKFAFCSSKFQFAFLLRLEQNKSWCQH